MNQHVGQQGQRLKGLLVKIDHVQPLEPNQFGPKTLVKFRDYEGNRLTWFASGARNFTAGVEVTIDATVKQFSEYRGTKETQVTRVKVHEGGT